MGAALCVLFPRCFTCWVASGVEPRLTGGFTAFPRRLAPFQQPGKMSETIEKLLAQEKTYRLVRRPAARLRETPQI